jgi:hypothetical protein
VSLHVVGVFLPQGVAPEELVPSPVGHPVAYTILLYFNGFFQKNDCGFNDFLCVV